MDFGAAANGILRDFGELFASGPAGWAMAGLIVGLPVAAAVLLAKEARLALIPLGLSASLAMLWVLYYATDWFSNPGMGGFQVAMLAVAIGWGVVLVAAVRKP